MPERRPNGLLRPRARFLRQCYHPNNCHPDENQDLRKPPTHLYIPPPPTTVFHISNVILNSFSGSIANRNRRTTNPTEQKAIKMNKNQAIKWGAITVAVIAAIPVVATAAMYLFMEILWSVACSSGC